MLLQEYIDEKSVALVMKGAKITSDMLAKALKKLLGDMNKTQAKGKPANNKAPKTYQGKQTVKQLVRQGVGVSNIEITDKNIKSFERVARKYGVDFALKKDATETPPKWLVFFKARDTDALTAAFKEFTAKAAREKSRPSLLAALGKAKELVKSQVVDKVRNKDKGIEL
jgi:hypothetical protein